MPIRGVNADTATGNSVTYCDIFDGATNNHSLPPQLQDAGPAIARMLAQPAIDLGEGGLKRGYREALYRLGSMVKTDTHGRITGANPNFCALNRCSFADVKGKTNRLFKSGVHQEEFYRDMWRQLNDDRIWHGEICNRALDGELYWVEAWIGPRYNRSGQKIGYASFRLDITARKLAEERAEQNARRCRQVELLLTDIVDALPNGVLVRDAKGNTIFENAAYLGRYASEPAAETISAAGHDGDGPEAWQPRSPAAPGVGQIHALSHDRWVQVDERHSRSGNAVAVWTDVTELNRALRRNVFQANHDELTELLNRRALLDALSRVVASAETATTTQVLALIDLDHFKSINDGLGHAAGDAFLRGFAANLTRAAAGDAVVARIGGDEFAVLFGWNRAAQPLATVLEDLRRAIQAPVGVGAGTVVPQASIGVCVVEVPFRDPGQIITAADLALRHCKREARGSSTVFTRSMQRQVRRRAWLTQQLRAALQGDHLTVALQPQRELASGIHRGFEALVRWRLRWCAIPPDLFIPIAEEAGLLNEIGRRVTEMACCIVGGLKARGLNPGRLAINVAASQLHDPDFLADLAEILARNGVQPDQLELEISENVIVGRGADSLAKVLAQARKLGIGIALDDFGTGYASLTHLQKFPVTCIKIDRSFVGNVACKTGDHVIVKSIVAIANNLGIDVVAEGVETEQQSQALIHIGCGFGQGYLLSRPINPPDLDQYFHKI